MYYYALKNGRYFEDSEMDCFIYVKFCKTTPSTEAARPQEFRQKLASKLEELQTDLKRLALRGQLPLHILVANAGDYTAVLGEYFTYIAMFQKRK